jgi:hypothetical protein
MKRILISVALFLTTAAIIGMLAAILMHRHLDRWPMIAEESSPEATSPIYAWILIAVLVALDALLLRSLRRPIPRGSS